VRNIRHHCAVLCAAALLAACASGGNRVSSRPELQPISLSVTNQNWLDVDGSNDTFTTDMIAVAPDEKLQLTVAPRMRMSSFAVWTR